MRKTRVFFGLILLFAGSCAHRETRAPASSPLLEIRKQVLETVEYPPLSLKLRAGYAMERAPLKACVLFLQGLADSVRNHDPYFSALNRAGYRVIFYDYLGQGGSEGSMNDTRIQTELPSNATEEMIRKHNARDLPAEIPVQGEFFWNRYSGVKNERGQDCAASKKFVIGWSTGGLAAYRMAFEKRADAVVLLAPALHPRWMVGESSKRWDKMLLLRQTISEATLTRYTFAGGQNPHLDPINPNSPVKVPQFAANLMMIASRSKRWKIDPSVPGLVFLSGAEDTYVNRDATLKTLTKNAAHFTVVSYDGALHELDNELPEVALDIQERTVRFLDSVSTR